MSVMEALRLAITDPFIRSLLLLPLLLAALIGKRLVREARSIVSSRVSFRAQVDGECGGTVDGGVRPRRTCCNCARRLGRDGGRFADFHGDYACTVSTK